MRRAQTYEEAFKEIVRLRAGKLKGQSPDVIKDRLRKTLGKPEEDTDAKFAIAAFADEAARTCGDDTISKAWENRSTTPPVLDLSSSLFKEANSGPAFYIRRDNVEKKADPDAKDVLEVYALCLLLGFKGTTSDIVRQKALASVKASLGVPSGLLAGSDLLASGNTTPVHRGFALGILILVAAIAFALALGHLSLKNDGIRLPPTIQKQGL